MRNVIFDLGGGVLEWNPEAILEKYYLDLDARAAIGELYAAEVARWHMSKLRKTGTAPPAATSHLSR